MRISILGNLSYILLLIGGLLLLAIILFTINLIFKRDISTTSKFLWTLVVFFLCPIGIVLYYLIGANQPKVDNQQKI